jgi:hypothetical protein
VTLTPSTGGGSCASVTATIGAGANGQKVTAVTATGCSGFSAPPSNPVFAPQGPADTDPVKAATATAAPGNSVAVTPAIETNPTTLKAIACNAGLGSSPVVSATYQTQIKTPTITAVDNANPPNTIAGSHINATSTVTIQTVSDFTDTKIVYTTDGLTTPSCTGTAGTSVNGNKATVTIPVPNGNTFTVNAIACGASQQAGSLVTRVFNIDVAPPQVASVANGVKLDPNNSFQIISQNDVTSTVTSPTAGSWVCYTSNTTGAVLPAPTCGTTAGTCAANVSAWTTLPATFNVNTNTTQLEAVACATVGGATVASAPTPVYAYSVGVTPITVVGTPVTNTCPATAVIGFDNTTATGSANLAAGGVTLGAALCYSFDGPPATCTAGVQPGNISVTCFAPTAANPTTTVQVFAGGSVYTKACKTGYSASSATLAVAANAYTPAAIMVDGSLASTEWSASAPLSNLFASDTAGSEGGLTFNAGRTTLYFAATGFTGAANSDVVVYLSDGTNTNSLTTGVGALSPSAGATLPFAAQHAIAISTTTPVAAKAYNVVNGAWAVDNTVTPTAAVTGTGLEFSIPTTAIDPLKKHISAAGIVATGPANNMALSQAWPQASGAWGYVSETLFSCQPPDSQVQ